MTRNPRRARVGALAAVVLAVVLAVVVGVALLGGGPPTGGGDRAGAPSSERSGSFATQPAAPTGPAPGTATGSAEGSGEGSGDDSGNDSGNDSGEGPGSGEDGSEDDSDWEVDPESGLPVIAEADLPAEARETLARIDAGGPYRYPGRDGTTFENREGLLPDAESGYYAEYTVPTPGEDDRGARRIVVGGGGEIYWTADHYESFELVRRAAGR